MRRPVPPDDPRRPRPRRLALAVAIALAAIGSAATGAVAEEPATTIVGASSQGDAHALARELRDLGFDAVVLPRLGALTVSGESIGAVRALVADDPRVDWIEPPHPRSLFALAVPDVDPFTDRPFAWAVDTVVPTDVAAPSAGPLPVTVGVVDSGLDVGHPDLAGRIGPAYDTLTDGTSVKDLVGHGTFVAGLISAIEGNELGGHGVAGATTVLPIRVTTSGVQIRSADIAEGIVKAVDAGAGVINLSLGGPTLSEVERVALGYAASKDVIVVAAAGNSFLSGNQVQYPAAAVGGVRGSWSAGLSVAATDPLGRRARFSSTNDFVSIAAPGAGLGECGDGVFSTIPANSASLWDSASSSSCTRVVESLGGPAGRYGYAEGTSFATPLVAGAAALARDVNPELSASQTADVIRRSATRTSPAAWNPETGAGILNVAGAVALARTYDTAPPVPALTATPTAAGVSVSLTARDVAGAGDVPAGVASYALDSSVDGITFSPAVGPGPAPIARDEPLPAGQARWYRGTVCDANHNCAVAHSGPVGPGAALAATIGRAPRIAAFAAGRPRTCATCVRVAVTVLGAGPMTWSIGLTPTRAGVKPIRRSGAVPRDGRLSASIPLSRVPTCRGRLSLTLTVSSPGGVVRSSRTLLASAACVPASRR